MSSHESNFDLPGAVDLDLAKVEDALRRIGALGGPVHRGKADQLAEQARELAYEVAKHRRSWAARSPQDEDHEAGIEAMLRVGPWRGLSAAERATTYRHNQAKEAIAAYLSHVSPSRDGTAAVEELAYLEHGGHVALVVRLAGVIDQTPSR